MDFLRILAEGKLEQSTDDQRTIIASALAHLNFIGMPSSFNLDDPAQEYAAWIFTKKNWRKLKIAGVPWIKSGQFKSRYHCSKLDNDGGIVENLSKGDRHTLTWQGDMLTCDCDSFTYGGHCKHVDFALALHQQPIKPPLLIPVDASESEPVGKPSAPTVQEILPGIIGTEDQCKAIDEILAFVQGSKKQLHALIGPAGTGKTLTLQASMSALRSNGWKGTIAMTAPTNKAVGVLRCMVERWKLGIECQTCAKLLGLKRQIADDGAEYYTPDIDTQGIANNYDLIIVDEASMVGCTDEGHKGLWEYLNESISLFTKMLFVGDYCQLPPVNEPISQVFITIPNPSWLHEIKRYDGAIAVLAEDVRQNLARQQKPRLTTQVNQDASKGVFLLKKDKWQSALVKAFSSDAYKLDPNHTRCLAYTNQKRKELNRFIRSGIYGRNAPRFQGGDRLIAEKPFRREHAGMFEAFSIATEMEVLTAVEGSYGEWSAWYLECQILDQAGTRINIPVLHEDSFTQFRDSQIKLKALGQHLAYHSNLELWAWINYAYCLTVHASQGSTYHNVFVDNKNIMRDKSHSQFTWPDGRSESIYERNQLLYVALTRASHRVFVYE